MKFSLLAVFLAIGVACVSAQVETFGNTTGRPSFVRLVQAAAIPNEIITRSIPFEGVIWEWESEIHFNTEF